MKNLAGILVVALAICASGRVALSAEGSDPRVLMKIPGYLAYDISSDGRRLNVVGGEQGDTTIAIYDLSDPKKITLLYSNQITAKIPPPPLKVKRSSALRFKFGEISFISRQ